MNVVKKKIQAAQERLARQPKPLSLWDHLNQNLCNWYYGAVGIELVPDGANIQQGNLKTLLADMPAACLGYYFGYPNDAPIGYVFIAPKYALSIGQKKINFAPETSAKEEASGLDLILVRPMAQLVMDFLAQQIAMSGDDYGSKFTILQEKLNCGDFTFDRSIKDWCLVGFCAHKEDGPEPPPTGNDQHRGEENVYILAPTPMIAPLLSDTAQLSDDSYDPYEPWAVHMRNALRTAPVKLQIGLETLRLSIAECTRLELGQVIELPGSSLQSVMVQLEICGEMVTIAHAELGIFKSNRAAQCRENMHPEFLGDVTTRI